MNIILTFLGIIVAIFLIKQCFLAVLHIIKYGIVLFFLIGMPIGFAYLVGWMGGDTAWTICKWSFYIGSAYGLITAIFHPSEYFGDIIDDFNSNSSSSSSSHGSYNDSYSESNYNDSGGGICGNCSYYDSSSHYCPLRHRSVSESSSGCSSMTYC